jgi:hypothetical protein
VSSGSALRAEFSGDENEGKCVVQKRGPKPGSEAENQTRMSTWTFEFPGFSLLSKLEEQFKPVRGDWCVGSEQFREEMLQYVEQQRGKWHYGQELAEAAQARAERLVQEALRVEGISESQLARWRKGHPFKTKLAAKLRAQTTVTVSWIAARLRTGTRGHLAHLLFTHQDQQSASAPLNQMRLGI